MGVREAELDAVGEAQGRDDTYVRDVLEEMRVLIVAGIPAGVLVAGFASRIAMLLLRLTSADGVRGVESDDGFTIGEVTLAGTYNLVLVGATVGIIGAAAYQWVRPWLLGPRWFRRTTVGIASGVVVGGMLIHADGVDFTVLEPTWLAIGLFVALPAAFGVVIGPMVDWVERPTSWAANGRSRWLVPVALVLVVPLSILIVLIAALVVAIWFAIRPTPVVSAVRTAPWFGWFVRAGWLSVAIAGLVVLIGDISDIAAVT